MTRLAAAAKMVLAAASALAALAAFASLASAETEMTLRYDASDFTAVEVQRGVQVRVRQSEEFGVRVYGEDRARISVRVRGDELQISRRGWFSIGDDGDARVEVSMPAITRLTASQGAGLSAYDIETQNLVLSVAQGGQLEVTGSCASLTASAAMGGALEAGALDCAEVEVSAAMGGLAEVRAREVLDASASMGGQVSVAGAPTSTQTHTSMGGGVSVE